LEATSYPPGSEESSHALLTSLPLIEYFSLRLTGGTINDRDFTVYAVRRQAARFSGRTRASAWCHCCVWLIIGLVTRPFVVTITSGTAALGLQIGIAAAFGAIGLTCALWESRRGVVGRETARIHLPMTSLYAATMVALAAAVVLFEVEDSPWFWACALAPS